MTQTNRTCSARSMEYSPACVPHSLQHSGRSFRPTFRMSAVYKGPKMPLCSQGKRYVTAMGDLLEAKYMNLDINKPMHEVHEVNKWPRNFNKWCYLVWQDIHCDYASQRHSLLSNHNTNKNSSLRGKHSSAPRKKHMEKFLVFQFERINEIGKEKVEIQSWWWDDQTTWVSLRLWSRWIWVLMEPEDATVATAQDQRKEDILKAYRWPLSSSPQRTWRFRKAHTGKTVVNSR